MSEKCPFKYPVSSRSKANRSPKRASYEQEPIHAIIDAAPICHVGFIHNSQPFVIPTIHTRVEDTLYFHGSPQSRLIQAIASGDPICVTFTFLDGIVVARSAMHHSMNYRSVVAFGSGRLVEGKSEKYEAYRLTVEKLLPDRWDECRQPSEAEDKVTAVAALKIEDASLKERTGGPNDIESDYAGPHWAGVLPMSVTYGEVIPDERLSNGTKVPEHIAVVARGAG